MWSRLRDASPGSAREHLPFSDRLTRSTQCRLGQAGVGNEQRRLRPVPSCPRKSSRWRPSLGARTLNKCVKQHLIRMVPGPGDCSGRLTSLAPACTSPPARRPGGSSDVPAGIRARNESFLFPLSLCGTGGWVSELLVGAGTSTNWSPVAGQLLSESPLPPRRSCPGYAVTRGLFSPLRLQPNSVVVMDVASSLSRVPPRRRGGQTLRASTDVPPCPSDLHSTSQSAGSDRRVVNVPGPTGGSGQLTFCAGATQPLTAPSSPAQGAEIPDRLRPSQLPQGPLPCPRARPASWN